MTVYAEVDHAHELFIRRSITGILILLNKTFIRWIYMGHKTVKTSTNSSELVASRIATEIIIKVT
jgi:hypothetical protein